MQCAYSVRVLTRTTHLSLDASLNVQKEQNRISGTGVNVSAFRGWYHCRFADFRKTVSRKRNTKSDPQIALTLYQLPFVRPYKFD